MQPNASSQCPKCGRPLQKFNGHIGFCSQHKWMSPSGAGYDAEAAEQNRLDAVAKEAHRLEIERQKAEEERKIQQEQHAATVRKVVVVIVALCAIAVAVVFFIIRPSVNYNGATDRFITGDYEGAKSTFTSLGTYKDSSSRAVLCEAMINLQEGRTEEAIEKLDQLTSDGTGDVTKQLADILLPVMTNWRGNGVSPEAMLLLLTRADIIDPTGTLNKTELNIEVHAAMLDDSVLDFYTEDINEDNEAELIILNDSYGVTIYRMASNGNVRMAVDNNITAACEMAFGDAYKDKDINVSVACYAEAYGMLPNDETRTSLTEAYRLRSINNENAGDMDAAIADARNAMETSGATDDFTFFYDVNLRNCKNGHDAATAIAMWDDFAEESVTEITRFRAKDRWNDDAAQLHLTRAAEFAAQKDKGCIDEIRLAAELGADVTSAIAEAKSHFEPGLSLARLHLMEIDILGDGSDKEQQIRSDMATDVRVAISEWKDRGVSPADVPAMIHLADAQGIDLSGIDRDSIYEEAALASAGSITQSTFVDWDKDGFKELLVIDAEGKLSLYGTVETWGIVSSVDTKLPGSFYTIIDVTDPLIMVVSNGRDELLTITGTSRKLSILFRETGISRYAVDGTTITFSKLLDGSIERYNDYTYEANKTENRPVRTSIDWQQNDYPEPVDGAAALQRYFETRIYDITDEAALLTANEAVNGFSLENMQALPVPAALGAVNASSYSTEDSKELFEIVYSTEGQNIRTWMAVVYDGGWKVAGTADTYGVGLDASRPDYSVPLISLNTETTDVIQDKGGKRTYRMLFPTSGSLSMLWQAGDKATSKNVFSISLYTKNYPFIRSLVGLVTGGISPFQCSVFYVNKVVSMGIDWGTDTPISVIDPIYRVPIDIRSYGDFSLQVENGQKLMEKLVGQTQGFSHEEIQQYFTNMMATHVRGVISGTMLERGLSPIGIDAHLADMSAAAAEKIAPIFEPYGLTVNHFVIAAITAPDLEEIKNKARELQSHRMETDVAAEDTVKAGHATAEANRALGFSAKEQAVAGIGQTLAGNPGPMLGVAGGMPFLGMSGVNVVQPSAAKTADIARMLLNHDEQSQQSSAGTEATAQEGGDSFEERVRKLKFMFDNGMISQEQFQEKINQIMSEI